MWAGFFCRQDVSISIFGRTKEFSEVRGTSLMCNFGVRSRFLDVIYGVHPPNGSPVSSIKRTYFLTIIVLFNRQRKHFGCMQLFFLCSCKAEQNIQHVNTNKIRPKKENVLFPVILPTLIFWGLLKLF